MTAPDKIWVFPKKDWFNAGASTHKIKSAGAKDVEYTRSDLIPAMLAEARAEGRREGLREALAVADENLDRVQPHVVDGSMEDETAQGYGNAAINIAHTLLALINAEPPAQPKPDAVRNYSDESTRAMCVQIMNRYNFSAGRSGAFLAKMDALAEGDIHE